MNTQQNMTPEQFHTNPHPRADDLTHDPTADQPPQRQTSLTILLGILLVIQVVLSGSPRLGATWIQGDERRFIANNTDVTGEGHPEPRWQQYFLLFTHYHDDLYQPLPLLTYAIEHDLWGPNDYAQVRLTDVLLHTINGLLLWGVLGALLRRFVPQTSATTRLLLSYALALLWVSHPINVSAYAADMGRTHLLSALFLMLAIRAHLSVLERPSLGMNLLWVLALIAANLSKPIVGWVAVVGLLEVHAYGWSTALRSWRCWFASLIGVAGAVVTLAATQHAQMLESITTLLFGDRFSRSFFGVWLHLYNVVIPTQLAMWYLPDPRAVWSHPLVWCGVAITGVSALLLLIAWLRRAAGIAIGLVWFWIVLLPVVGIVGARVASANDRYVYVPMMGILLIVGIGLAHLAKRYQRATLTLTLLICAGLAIVLMPLDRHLVATARSTIDRSLHTIQVYPGHRFGYETLAMAYLYSADHDDTLENHEKGPDALRQAAREAIDKTIEIAEQHPEQFASEADRAGFYRRMALRYMAFNEPQLALQYAKRAAEIEPDTVATDTNLAQALRSAHEWQAAGAVYAKLVPLLKPDTPYRALRLIEYADLLLYRLDQPAKALEHYRAAVDDPALTPQQRDIALSGLALAEIRAGLGATGYKIVSDLLKKHPDDPALAMTLGEYHLRSHHFEQAVKTYAYLVSHDPTNMRALRGLHSAAAELGEYEIAANAWSLAVQVEPKNRTARSFLVWALASGNSPKAAEACQTLLASDPENPFACFGEMLLALYQDDVDQALPWRERGLKGEPIPEAQAPARAAATLERLAKHEALSTTAYLFAASLWETLGVNSRTQAALACYFTATNPDKSPGEFDDDLTALIARLGLSNSVEAAWAAFQSKSANCY